MKGLQLFLLALLPCAAGWLLPQGNVIFSDAYLGAVEMVEGWLLVGVSYWAGGFWRHRMKGTGRSLLLANLPGIVCTIAFVLSVLLSFSLQNTFLYRMPVVAQLVQGQFTAQYFSGLLLHRYVWPIFSHNLIGYPVTLGLQLLVFWLGYRFKRR